MVEEALTESGFQTDILASAEEALTLFKSRNKGYRDWLILKGRLSGSDVVRQIRERVGFSGRLHDRRSS